MKAALRSHAPIQRWRLLDRALLATALLLVMIFLGVQLARAMGIVPAAGSTIRF